MKGDHESTQTTIDVNIWNDGVLLKSNSHGHKNWAWGQCPHIIILPLKSWFSCCLWQWDLVSRTGSVATGPMVCLAGRIMSRPCLLPETKWGLKSRGHPQKHWPPLQPSLRPPIQRLRILKEEPCSTSLSEQAALIRGEISPSFHYFGLKSCFIAKRRCQTFHLVTYSESHRLLFIFHLQNYLIN